MRTFLGWTSALVLAIALAGCTSAPPSSAPCSSCKWSARNFQGPSGDPFLGCIVNGKKVDCKKTPPECPECAKAMQGK